MKMKDALARLGRRREQRPWTTGYFVPEPETGSMAALAGDGARADVLYVRVGELSPVSNKEVELQLSRPRWPRQLPPAATYVGQWHNVTRVCPPPALAAALASCHARIALEAARAGARLVGLQLDYDCPTISLGRYAAFLRALRQALPPSAVLSITARLDWFRSGTRIAEVMPLVDEHVPLIGERAPLDVDGDERSMDPLRWTPRFDALGRPYRIGYPTSAPPSPDGVRGADPRLCAGIVMRWPLALDAPPQRAGS